MTFATPAVVIITARPLSLCSVEWKRRGKKTIVSFRLCLAIILECPQRRVWRSIQFATYCSAIVHCYRPVVSRHRNAATTPPPAAAAASTTPPSATERAATLKVRVYKVLLLLLLFSEFCRLTNSLVITTTTTPASTESVSVEHDASTNSSHNQPSAKRARLHQ